MNYIVILLDYIILFVVRVCVYVCEGTLQNMKLLCRWAKSNRNKNSTNLIIKAISHNSVKTKCKYFIRIFQNSMLI